MLDTQEYETKLTFVKLNYLRYYWSIAEWSIFSKLMPFKALSNFKPLMYQIEARRFTTTHLTN